MTISNYPNGFSDGVTIHNIPYVTTQNKNGNVYWVDSAQGSNGNKGTFTLPFSTIDYAVGRCTADQGDTIIVAAGHTESVIAASGLDLDVAGITIIFMGEGTNRATIDFGTAVTATMDIAAANITLVNPRFTASIDALTGPINIAAANFKIVNGEYYDGTSIDTTDCIVAAATATGLKIHGWKYTVGDEGGTQKQSNIQLNGVDNAELIDIDITGDFATGNIENVTDEVLNIRLENIKINNTNSGPAPGIVLDANATGLAKNIDIRIASGTTYVSSVAKLNFDSKSYGYNADGEGGDPIGTAAAVGVEAKVDAVQADLGNPSARTNHQDIENMIGVPDTANSSLDDMIRTGYDSTAIAANRDGSLMERQEFTQIQVTKSSSKNLASITTADVFVVAGGLVKVLNITGFVNTAFQASANNTKLVNKATVGGNVDLCAVLDVTGAAQASFLSITGTFANALVNSGTTGVKAAEQADAFIVSPGTIEMNCAATTTGDVTWYIEYQAMDTDATIVAA